MADPEAPEAPAEPETPPTPETPPAPSEPAADELGETGKKALETERKARRDAERSRKKLEDELAELRKSQMSDQEKAVEEARSAGAKEVAETYERRLFVAEAKVAAGGKLANPNLLSKPETALGLLGLDAVPVDSDGQIDTEAISAAIDKLVTAEPYLAANPAAPRGTNGGANQGPQGGTQLTTDQRLAEAAKSGDTAAFIALQTSRLTELSGNP